MSPHQGSVGWTAATLTAAHLRTQASLVSGLMSVDDEDFTLVIAHALRYWNVNAASLGDAFGVTALNATHWAAGLHLPQLFARHNILEWIADDLDKRAEAIEGMLDFPPPDPLEQTGKQHA